MNAASIFRKAKKSNCKRNAYRNTRRKWRKLKDSVIILLSMAQDKRCGPSSNTSPKNKYGNKRNNNNYRKRELLCR
jgi:hypothetical protein